MWSEQEFLFVYENGVLKPDRSLDLPEGARGMARIRAVTPGLSARQRALEAIHRIGESGCFNSGGLTLTREQMHERRSHSTGQNPL